jgi:uncharacterized protein with GYD domain
LAPLLQEPRIPTLDGLGRQTLTWPGHSGQRRQEAYLGEFLPAQERGRSMPTFVSLVNWTDQGIKNYRDSVRRAEDYRGLVEKHGGQVRQLVWTLGEYDVVAVTDFPDDETATAVALQTGALGNIRTRTMKAFDAEQMSAIIQRTG